MTLEAALKDIGRDKLLSFRTVGRVMPVIDVAAEFALMRAACGRSVTPVIMERICKRSGTHLVKLVSPRVDGHHAVLRVERGEDSRSTPLLPSVNAADIPFAKLIFRPLEITGHPPRSVVDHVMDPDHLSDTILASFEGVFGRDVLEAIRESLLGTAPVIQKLAAGEFPIIFIPSPKGGDLQVTPVAPAAAYMGMKDVAAPYFQKRESGGPPLPRSKWHRLTVSGKPRNISGAIRGPRLRFRATMPATMLRLEAAIWRFVHGGPFPRWFDSSMEQAVLDYAQALEIARVFSNSNIRAGLNSRADGLIRDAIVFATETMEEARHLAEGQGMALESLAAPPRPRSLLLSLFGRGTDRFERARWALDSVHFDHREQYHRTLKAD